MTSNLTIIGRRGPQNCSFTIKEFRDLTKKENLHVNLSSEDFKHVDFNVLPGPKYRLLELMKKTSSNEKILKEKECRIRFFTKPNRFIFDEKKKLTGIEIEDTRTGECSVIACELAITCVGYQSTAISSLVHYDTVKGHVLHNNSRIISKESGDTIKGLYCSGWIKTGPKGTIVDSIADAHETARIIMNDIESGVIKKNSSSESIDELLRRKNIKPKSFGDWKELDLQEQSEGYKLGKIREKLVSICEDEKI